MHGAEGRFAARIVYDAALSGRGVYATACDFNRTIGDVTGVPAV